MKISQVMLAKGFGGAERLFVDLCLALVEDGQDIQAICQSGSSAAEILSRHPEVKLQTILVLGMWDFLATRKIAQLLVQHECQVVQAHLARGAILAGKACVKLSLPLVVTTHNYIDVKYYKHVTMLVPPTKDQYAYYLGKGITADRLKIINHFSPIEPEIKIRNGNPEKLRIVALGRLVHKKGFHVLLEAFAMLNRETNIQYELHIGGTGPEHRPLAALIETLGLKDKVAMVGWVDDIEKFLNAGDIFVMPSLDEPFGIVVLEAMAMGLPIVSSDSQGPKEILDSDIAWLANVGDVESLTEALLAACNNHEERRRKSEKAQRRFKQLYSKRAVIPEFIGLYDSVLKAKIKPSPR